MENPQPKSFQEEEEAASENAEFVLFHTSECYVYMIPPRRSSASYRADEWNVNKWTWEGSLRVVSKGDNCFIKLEDKNSGELFAQAFVRQGHPLPVEPVIDSSRYFVLCIEETFDGKTRHAFIGIGFRERDHAYDFQAALYDHVKYLSKKQAAEELEQEHQRKPSVDYSLKEGQTIKLQLKNPINETAAKKSVFFERNFDRVSLGDASDRKTSLPCLAPPPPPLKTTMLPTSSPKESPTHLKIERVSMTSQLHGTKTEQQQLSRSEKDQADKSVGNEDQTEDEEFGDFQTAN